MISQLCPFVVSCVGFIENKLFGVELIIMKLKDLSKKKSGLVSGKRGYECTLESSDLSTVLHPFRGHLLQGQSFSPVPRPPSLPFTHLWPVVHVPASLGINLRPRSLESKKWRDYPEKGSAIFFPRHCIFGKIFL